VPSPHGVDWSNEQVGRPLHIINCHGFPHTPFFSGRREKGPTYPALLPEQIDGRLCWGTVAAVSCCYGADLYAPLGDGSSTRYMPMCNAFLANGAIGYFGSTGSSHGGRFHPKEADLLVREFVRTWLQGGSLGEASRHSILQLISSSSGLDPARVRKNAWQFILLGDPTARPNRSGASRPVGPASASSPGTERRAPVRMVKRAVASFGRSCAALRRRRAASRR
jgi:hypothetical protein